MTIHIHIYIYIYIYTPINIYIKVYEYRKLYMHIHTHKHKHKHTHTYIYTHIYIYIYIKVKLVMLVEGDLKAPLLLATRVFANGPGDLGSIQSLKKWYLMPPCLIISNIKYGSRAKWSNPGKEVAPSTTTVIAIEKGAFMLPSTTFTNLLYTEV